MTSSGYRPVYHPQPTVSGDEDRSMDQQQHQQTTAATSHELHHSHHHHPPPAAASMSAISLHHVGCRLLSPFFTFSSYVPGMHAEMAYPGLASCVEFMTTSTLAEFLAKAAHHARLEDYRSSRAMYEEVKQWLEEAHELEQFKAKNPQPQQLSLSQPIPGISEHSQPHPFIRQYSVNDRAKLYAIMKDNLQCLDECEASLPYYVAKRPQRIGYRTYDGRSICFKQFPLMDGSANMNQSDPTKTERYWFDRSMREEYPPKLWQMFHRLCETHAQNVISFPPSRRSGYVTIEDVSQSPGWQQTQLEQIRGILQSWCVKGQATTPDGITFKSIPEAQQQVIKKNMQLQQQRINPSSQCPLQPPSDSASTINQPFAHLVSQLQQAATSTASSFRPGPPVAAGTGRSISSNVPLSTDPNFIPCAPPSSSPRSISMPLTRIPPIVQQLPTGSSFIPLAPPVDRMDLTSLVDEELFDPSKVQGECKFGELCWKEDSQHFREWSHPRTHPLAVAIAPPKPGTTTTKTATVATSSIRAAAMSDGSGSELEEDDFLSDQESKSSRSSSSSSTVTPSPPTTDSAAATTPCVLNAPPAPIIHPTKSGEIHAEATAVTNAASSSEEEMTPPLFFSPSDPYVSPPFIPLPAPPAPKITSKSERLVDRSEMPHASGMMDEEDSPLVRRKVQNIRRRKTIAESPTAAELVASIEDSDDEIKTTESMEVDTTASLHPTTTKAEAGKVTTEAQFRAQQQQLQPESQSKPRRESKRKRSHSTDATAVTADDETKEAEQLMTGEDNRQRRELKKHRKAAGPTKQMPTEPPPITTSQRPPSTAPSPEPMDTASQVMQEKVVDEEMKESTIQALDDRDTQLSIKIKWKRNIHSPPLPDTKSIAKTSTTKPTTKPPLPPTNATRSTAATKSSIPTLPSLVDRQFESREEAIRVKRQFDAKRAKAAKVATVAPTAAVISKPVESATAVNSKPLTTSLAGPIPFSISKKTMIPVAQPTKTATSSTTIAINRTQAPASSSKVASRSIPISAPVPLVSQPSPSIASPTISPQPSAADDLVLEERKVVNPETGATKVVYVFVHTKRSWQREGKRLASRDETIEEDIMDEATTYTSKPKKLKTKSMTPILTTLEKRERAPTTTATKSQSTTTATTKSSAATVPASAAIANQPTSSQTRSRGSFSHPFRKKIPQVSPTVDDEVEDEIEEFESPEAAPTTEAPTPESITDSPFL